MNAKLRLYSISVWSIGYDYFFVLSTSNFPKVSNFIS